MGCRQLQRCHLISLRLAASREDTAFWAVSASINIGDRLDEFYTRVLVNSFLNPIHPFLRVRLGYKTRQMNDVAFAAHQLD